MSDVVKEAAVDRISGERPGRWRAIAAAVVVGAGTAMLVYRLLRSDPDEEPADDAEREAGEN